MSLTLTTIADALIEFILSLLRDPAAAAEFDDDPEGMLAQRGLNHANASDVASVAPIVIERTQVIQVVKPVAVEHHANPVVREIKQITTHVQWVDDRDTIVDQSVNQNIWAEGDVTQTFDQEAVVASGDDAMAAGENLDNEESLDQSTTIEAGGDANIGNETDVTVIEDSMNEDSDTSTTTDESTVVVVEDSGNDESTDVTLDDSANTTTEESTETDIDASTAVVEEAPTETVVTEEAPAEEPATEAPDPYAEYTDASVESDLTGAFDELDTALTSEIPADDDL
ncbi:IniB N-terminal domain-containing protein [Microbacterium sp.]|uniref:IniB N-terminal domain-containing protein n=1 Tax=Microbacterium sp. TaxID=51671 RepID=UPI003F6E8E5A